MGINLYYPLSAYFTLQPASSIMNLHSARLPMLCDCQRLEGCVEHQDMHSSYALWVLHSDGAHVVFLDRKWLDEIVYLDGVTKFRDLIEYRSPLEGCKMISRILLGALKYKPDYMVVVSSDGRGAPLTSGHTMEVALNTYRTDLDAIKRAAEGPERRNNYLGAALSELCGALANRGFFNNPKNRRYSKMAVMHEERPQEEDRPRKTVHFT